MSLEQGTRGAVDHFGISLPGDFWLQNKNLQQCRIVRDCPVLVMKGLKSSPRIQEET